MAEPQITTSAPMPAAPRPVTPVASDNKNSSPYDTTGLGENKNGIVGEIAAGVLKPIVQTGVSLIDPFADLVSLVQGKRQGKLGGGFRIKSDFLGGADGGYVYSFMDQTDIRARRLSGRFRNGEISFAKGLLGATAAGVEPALDVGSLVYGGGAAKNVLSAGGKVVFKDLVTTSLRESLKRGGAIAGAYDVVAQLQEAKDFNAMRTLGAVAAGTVLDVGLSKGIPAFGMAIGKGGELVYKAIPQSVKSRVAAGVEAVSDSKVGQVATTFFGNKTSLLKKQFGETGEKVSTMFQRAYERMNEDVGKFQKGLIDLGLIKAPVGARRKFAPQLERWADREFRYDVRDALGKTGKFADPKVLDQAMKTDPDLSKIVNFFDEYRKDKGLLGQQMNIVDNLEDIDTYFSRYTPHVQLRGRFAQQLKNATTDGEREAIYAANSEAVTDMIDYGFTRENKWANRLEAFQTYYDAMDVSLETNRVKDNDNAYFKWLVKNGHASSIADAKARFVGDLDRRQGTLTPRIASFDYERQIPLPWNDPDPVRVMTKYIEDTNKRIAYAEQFGANDEILNEIVTTLKNDKGVTQANQFVDIFRRLTGQVERKPMQQRVASLLTNVETLRLFSSALLNVPQALLYAIPTDFSALGAGMRAVFSRQNMVESLERGVYLSDLARQTRTLTTMDQKIADTVMQYSGFGYLDMMVKSMGSGVADTWTRRTLASLEKKIGREIPEAEREAFVKQTARNRDFQRKALREGYGIQKENARLFNKEFNGEDFVAVAGQRGRARAYSASLDAIHKRELARLNGVRERFEKSLMREGKPFASKSEEIKSLVSDIKEIRESIAIYEGGTEKAPAGLEEQFSQRQVDEGLAEAKRLLMESMNARIEELTGRFDEAAAVGMVEGQSFATPKLEGEQRVAQLNERIKSIKDSIAKAEAGYTRKKELLDSIGNSYELAEKRMSDENPDIVAYRSSKEARKGELSTKNLSQYQEYHYLKELGIDPEEVLARGHLTEEDLATATQSLVEQTQGSNNPLLTPLFAESPAGKVFYQFKKIVLQQSLFFGRQIKRNFISKDTRSVGNATRFLTVAFALYPPTVGVIRDLRDIAIGRKDPDEAFEFDKYYSSLNILAATGLFMDFAKSFDSGRELDFFAPIVVSDAKEYLSGIFKLGKGVVTADTDTLLGGFDALFKQGVKQTGVGTILSNYLNKD